MSKKILSVLLIVILLFSTFAIFNASAKTDKISEELKIHIETDSGKIPVYIWFEDLDLDQFKEEAYSDIGYTQEDIINCENKIPLLNSNIDEEDMTAIDSYISETKTEKAKILEMQNNLIAKQREIISDAYKVYNYENLKKINLEKESVIYSSVFSPVIIANLTKEQIYDLTKAEYVVGLEYKDTNPPKPEQSYALSTIDGKYVRDTLGYDGHNVKVGIFDGGKVKKVSALSNTSITNLNSSASYSSHATTIANIIAGSNGFAPNAHIYCNSSNTSSEEGLEQLISKNVVVINISLGYGRESGVYYTGFEKWIDHISSQHGITIVKSAGNGGTNSVITSPGLAYNVITVGATNTKFTNTKSDDYYCSYNSTANGGTSGCAKPDVIAPGEYNNIYNDNFEITSGGGTSFAAPAVVGVIAQMIECRPTISTNPAIIKAVLTASTTRKLPLTSGGTVPEAWAGNITAKEGAGEISARKAIYILSKGNYSTGTISSSTITKSFTVTSSDLYIRYGLSWLRKSTAGTDHTNTSSTATTHANLRLRLYDPNSTLLVTSNVTNSSVELAHINISGVYGTYKAKISRVDSGTNSVTYAVAWR